MCCYIFISTPVILVWSFKHVAVIVQNCTSSGVICLTCKAESLAMCLINVCVLRNAEGSYDRRETAASLDYSAAASSCLLRHMNVREWITYWAVTRVQHNKGSIFNTCHQNSVKCNFIYSNIQFPENKKFTKLLHRWNEIQDLQKYYIHLGQLGVSTEFLTCSKCWRWVS